MIMYLPGTDSIQVHPTKVEEMERKGWSKTPPKSVKGKDGNTQGK